MIRASVLAEHDVALVVGAPTFRYYPWVPGPYLPPGWGCCTSPTTRPRPAAPRVGDSLLGDPVLSLAALTDALTDALAGHTRPPPGRTPGCRT